MLKCYSTRQQIRNKDWKCLCYLQNKLCYISVLQLLLTGSQWENVRQRDNIRNTLKRWQWLVLVFSSKSTVLVSNLLQSISECEYTKTVKLYRVCPLPDYCACALNSRDYNSKEPNVPTNHIFYLYCFVLTFISCSFCVTNTYDDSKS